jgi:hypothetical protein
MFYKILKKLIGTALIICVAFVTVVIVVVSFRNPQTDRDWSADQKLLPHIIITDNTVTVDTIRDFRYASGTVVSTDYYNESFDTGEIQKVYFVINPFGEWQGIGHTFFVFTFTNGSSVSVSVEARREADESYSAIKGLLNNYELWYGWGSAADFLSRRAVFYGEELNMYPLDISTTTAQGLFLDLARTTEKLETKADFYNTLLSNCAEVLVRAANRVNKDAIPWTFAQIFPGYADDKLYELGLIPHDKPFAEINKEGRVDGKIREIMKDDVEMERNIFWRTLESNMVLK